MKADAAMPQPTTAPAGSIALSVIPSRNVALCGVKQTVRALVQITTPPAPADQPRPRLHVACVLDKSGSMAGAKLKMAKRAVRKLIKHLSPPDQLHFVTYDSNVQTVFENGDLSPNGKLDLVAKVKSVGAGTCTNLAGGLERGVGALNASAATAAAAGQPPPDVKRVFLFSDGLVNAGEQDHARILAAVGRYVAQGVTVSTFGIGADFDEKLMTGIATRGKGDYAFLETPESIAPLVSKSVHSLLLLAGSEATLQVAGVNGAVLSKVYHEDEDDSEDAPTGTLLGGVAIGDLHAENVKSILVELEVAPPGALGAGGAPPAPQAVCEVVLAYAKPAGGGAPGGAAERVTVRATLVMAFTSDRDALGEENGEVAAAHMVQMAAALDNDVMDLVSRGQVEEAITMKERNLDTMTTLVAQLEHDPAHMDGSSARMLSRCVQRQRGTVENMRRNKDSRTVSMDMRSEQRIQRRMSMCAYASGCDSDDGGYSDDGICDGDGLFAARAAPPLQPQQQQQQPQRQRRRLSSDSDSSDDAVNDGDSYALPRGRGATSPVGNVQARRRLPSSVPCSSIPRARPRRQLLGPSPGPIRPRHCRAAPAAAAWRTARAQARPRRTRAPRHRQRPPNRTRQATRKRLGCSVGSRVDSSATGSAIKQRERLASSSSTPAAIKCLPCLFRRIYFPVFDPELN